MTPILNSPSLKALAQDFILTLGVAYGALAISPANFQDLFAAGDVLAFAVFKSAIQAIVKATLKWTNAA